MTEKNRPNLAPVISVLAALSVGCVQKSDLAVNIEGWERHDSVNVMLYYPDGSRTSENIPLRAGRFEYDIPGEVPLRLLASVPNEEDRGYLLFSSIIETMIAPADKVTIDGAVSDDGVLHYDATGAPPSAYYATVLPYSSSQEFQGKLDALSPDFTLCRRTSKYFTHFWEKATIYT